MMKGFDGCIHDRDAQTGQPLLSFRNVERLFLQKTSFFSTPRVLRAVDGVSLNLWPGESVALVGESGCGKSTLGRLACGLLLPDSGEVIFRDRILPLAGSGSWACGRIQMVFQDPSSSLNPRLRVRSSIAEPLAAKGVKEQEREKFADDMLEIVGLRGYGDRYPHEFSGGQRQRIAIARALITHPEVIVCDEPVSALDASVQAQILNLLREIQEDLGPAYLFISHDLAVVGFLCTRVVVMYLGQLVETAPSDVFFTSAMHPYSLALLAAVPNDVRATARLSGKDRLPEPLHGDPPSPLFPPSGCRFHPRCPTAMPICSVEPPTWHTLGAGWHVRCHLADNWNQ